MPLSSVRALFPLLGLLSATFAAAPPRPQFAEDLPGRALYRAALPSVAWVHAAGQGKGSGWIVDVPRRLLITNYHVVGDNDSVEVVFPVRSAGQVIGARAYYLEHMPRLRREGLVVRGKVVRREPEVDLALIELESLPEGVVGLRLGPASAQPGDRVHALGNRYDSPVLWVYVAGSVRQLRRLPEGYFNSGKQLAKGARVVEAALPVNEGDSGGPLLDAHGDVVGVTAAVAWERGGAGLFLDLDEVRAFLTRAEVRPASPARTEPSAETPTPARQPGRDLYRRALTSFTLVRQPDNPRRGSGFVIDRTGRLLLTDASLVGTRPTVEITFPTARAGQVVTDAAFYTTQAVDLRGQGRIVTGVVLARDERRNLALIEVSSLPDDVTALRLAQDAAEPGDAAHLLGNPERSEALWAYAAATVRQVGRTNLGRGQDADAEVLLVQASFAEGEAGGPVLDVSGDLIGVVSGKAAPQQQLSYALAASEVRTFLAERRSLWQPGSATEWRERGRLFSRARQYEGAVQAFTDALSADPSNATACCERGEALDRLGRHEQAIADCTRALDLDRPLAAAHACRARAQAALGKPREALTDADAAVRLDAHDAGARVSRAQVRRLLADLDGALADCDEAVWLDAKRAEAYLERGLVHAARGRTEPALADLDRALLLDPEATVVYRHRGDVYWAGEDVAAALADYEKALARQPEDAHALLGRGRARLARRDAAGLADLDAALRRAPDLAEVWVERGNERLRRDDVAGGASDLEQALRLRPALTAEVLGVVARRGEALSEAARADLLGRILTAALPAVRERGALGRGLEAARGEKDPTKRVQALTRLMGEMRESLR